MSVCRIGTLRAAMGFLREKVRSVGARLGARINEELGARLASRLGLDPRPTTPEVDPDPPDPESPKKPNFTPVTVVPRADVVQIGRRPAGPSRTVRAVPTLDSGAPVLDPGDAVDGTIRILAEPLDNERCRLHIGHTFAGGFGWWFPKAPSAEEAPLAAALFEVSEVTSVLVDDRTVTLSRPKDSTEDWKPTAELAARHIRNHLGSGDPVLPEGLRAQIPSEEDVRRYIEGVLATEVNPGVAAHEGRVELIRVRGNSVWIKMGGGCQGCSAADQTLRNGIDSAFRRVVPALAGVYDDTDHAAGETPFFR